MSANNNDSGFASSTKESGNGVAHEIGVANEAPAAETIVAEEARSDNKFIDIPVSWGITGDTFVNTTGDIAQYISSYKLNASKENPSFDWRLEFYNVQNKIFGFMDSSGDLYELATYSTHLYSVLYNSVEPQIKIIRIRDQ